MTTLDDGDVVRQARRNDPRITRLGALPARWNIDELPQLINVIKGDMSLVGPRPHALSHNREYEQQITRYARRHNVQAGHHRLGAGNGFRGETDTDDKMRARVEHDLYYIDNWSLWLDLRILLWTVLSRGVREARLRSSFGGQPTLLHKPSGLPTEAAQRRRLVPLTIRTSTTSRLPNFKSAGC